MRRVKIAGVGLIKIQEYWDSSIQDLFAEASLKAIKDSGVDDIDRVYVSNMSAALMQDQLNLAAIMTDSLGKPGLPATRIEASSASGGVAFHEAVQAVASGFSDAVLVTGVEKMSDILPEVVTTSLAMAEEQEYTSYTGVTKAGLAAMIHRLYMDLYASAEEIGMMAVKSHDHAVGCKHAQYPFKMSIERAMSSPMEADPIHSMECSGIGDGAAAIVLVPADKTGVEVVGTAISTDYTSIAQRPDPLEMKAIKTAANKAYNMAGIKPKDVSLAEVQDDFTINGVLGIEGLGLAKTGEGAKLVSSPEVDKDGKIPVNTFGGLKARGNPIGATGIYQLGEIALQLRGDAGAHQVNDAEIGVAQNMGGMASICAVNILRRVGQ
ncbi:thiolase domain-containing protein [Candidatus Bathyarchaeota archaeon]|nr:thiolase domain-containing protein [Candidatus Bathyarchaeota archaeon]